MRPLPPLLLLVLLPAVGCTVAGPLEGPGFDGQLRTTSEGPFVVVVTHTRVKAGAGDGFDDAVDAIDEQLDASPGFVASSLRAKLPGRERWTMTVWEDEESVFAFAASGAHLEAMVDQGALIDGVVSATFTVTADELPVDWADALQRLEEQAPEVPW